MCVCVCVCARACVCGLFVCLFVCSLVGGSVGRLVKIQSRYLDIAFFHVFVVVFFNTFCCFLCVGEP